LLEPLWSIGVEEWFYLIWGPVLKYIPKDVWKWITLLLLLKLTVNYLASQGLFPPLLGYVIKMMRFEAMFVGGLFACSFFTTQKTQNQISKLRTPFLISALIGCFGIVFFGNYFDLFLQKLGIADKSLNLFICSVFFGLLIWSIAWRNQKNLFLDSKVVVFLGEISYGIYMYHLLVVTVVWAVLLPLKLGFVTETILYHFIAIALTILLAAISKTYFENPILKLKNRFSV
jgi:peptidoglycan/LPS O-acetylase OafA/YrhL